MSKSKIKLDLNKLNLKKSNFKKLDLKKAVLYSSLCVGCVAVIMGAMAAPLNNLLHGGGISMRGDSIQEQDTSQDVSNLENYNSAQDGEEAVETAADGNWGLSFQQEGSAPVGNASQEYLAKYNAFYIGPSGDESKTTVKDKEKIDESREDGADTAAKKTIYLTFDAGYENGYTSKILDVLKEEEVPAAFFVVGNFIEENPDLVKRMEAEGHIVGNHTMHHPDMSAIADEEAFKEEINQLEEAYKTAVGKELPKFYRPPQGKYSESNLEQASKLGYTTVFWSLAYVDWLENDQPTREEALNILNKRIHPGAIVLLHSTSKTNSQILGELIQGWKAKGYEFHSISELGTGKF